MADESALESAALKVYQAYLRGHSWVDLLPSIADLGRALQNSSDPHAPWPFERTKRATPQAKWPFEGFAVLPPQTPWPLELVPIPWRELKKERELAKWL